MSGKKYLLNFLNSTKNINLLFSLSRGILYEDGEWRVKTTKLAQTRKPKREKFELGKQNLISR